jgi:hypothetical protein
MNNPEDIVQMAVASVKEVYTSHESSILLQEFELKLRRQIMQASSVKKEHTYTINPPNLMGTWTTGGVQARTMGIPPTITGPNKEILHG